LDWLDPDSSKAAEEKANYIGIKIGYATSPNVTSPVALRGWYAPNQPKKGQFFESTLNTRVVDERRKWASIGKERDPGAWEMIPSEVNAYYSPEANEMAFPAGVLQAPYFSKDYPEYLGFGSMASLAGHELTVCNPASVHLSKAQSVYCNSTPLTLLVGNSTRLASLPTGGQT
jgi:endothelin-converting enzyme